MRSSMHMLTELERDLAGVLSLSDLTGNILERFRCLLDASGAAVFSFEAAGAPVCSGGWLGPVLQGYTPDLFLDDPIQRFNSRMGASLVNAGAGFNWQLLARSRVYADFYRPHEIGLLSGVYPSGLAFGSHGMFGIVLVTPTLSRRFREKGFEELVYLEPALRSVGRRILRFRELEQKVDVLGQLLERQAKSFVLWQPSGAICCVSQAAQRDLDSSARAALEAAARLARRQLRAVTAHESPRLLGRSRQLSTARGATLRVEFSWIAAADGRPWLLAELQNCSGAAALVARLTTAQTNVLRLLTQGLSTNELAARLGISGETVKTHVKSILSQLGVHSRAKAVHLASQIWMQ